MRVRLGWLAWWLLVVACITLPLHALYGQGGPFERQLANSAPWKSLDECLLLLGALYVALRWRRGGVVLGIVAFEAFARRHGIDLTLAMLLLYVGGMHALGRLCVSVESNRVDRVADALRHVLVGMMAWAALTWLASLAGMGTVAEIRWLAIGVLGGALALDTWRQRARLHWPARPTGRLSAFLLALALTVVAMLAAKAAAALDGDALWYGVNADRVLLGAGNLFASQGLVVHVHYYPKLAESLQIPFMGLGSASLVTGLSLACWLLLVATCRELLREAGVVAAPLAWGGALFATCIPAVAASAATPKGEVLAAWLCLMALLAAMRLPRATGRDAATWLAAGLVAALLAPLARLTVLPYAAAIFVFVAWQAVRQHLRPTLRRTWLVYTTGLLVVALVCWRTWVMTGVALATPDVLVDLQGWLGWHLHDDIGRYVPDFRTPFPSGLVQSLFGPRAYIHQALFWMGNAWIPLLAFALVRRGWRWILADGLLFWLMLGLAMYAMLYAYRFGPDGPDGNYFIVCIVLLHLVAWAGCAGPATTAPRPFLAGAAALLALSLFMVLTTANWLPGLARLDARFDRTPFGELDRMAAARYRVSGMGPLAGVVAAYPASTRMVGDLDVGDGGFFNVSYESLNSVAWARPPLLADNAAVQAFLLSHRIRLVVLARPGNPAVARTVRPALEALVATGRARQLNAGGAPADLWEVLDAPGFPQTLR
ncbi:hypothetical protein KPL74_13190 [Bacillus sp. NP157]|nr:hypothetical protein KPL74_13190 [Bacillus sp. NP157]